MVKAQRRDELRKREALGGSVEECASGELAKKKNQACPGQEGGAGSSCHNADHMTESILSQWKEIINPGCSYFILEPRC